MMSTSTSSSYVLPLKPTCHCGTRWERRDHPTLLAKESFCTVCGTTERYRLRINRAGFERTEILFTSKGKPIDSLACAVATGKQILFEINEGTFKQSRYKKNNMFITVAEFIEKHVVHVCILTDTEREFLQDFMAPFFSEVSVFTVCKIHLQDFINTFGLKGQRKDMAQRLFERVTSEIVI